MPSPPDVSAALLYYYLPTPNAWLELPEEEGWATVVIAVQRRFYPHSEVVVVVFGIMWECSSYSSDYKITVLVHQRILCKVIRDFGSHPPGERHKWMRCSGSRNNDSFMFLRTVHQRKLSPIWFLSPRLCRVNGFHWKATTMNAVQTIQGLVGRTSMWRFLWKSSHRSNLLETKDSLKI